jgi:hypothetical protein
MRCIERQEMASDEAAQSSYHPLQCPSMDATPTLSNGSSNPNMSNGASNGDTGDSAHISESTNTIELNSRSPPSSGSRYWPCHYFDYIGGTSTGG